ncbi:periplasmic binding protein-like I [Catenaria anguillulae PL171]|uniref:Periplasmic binding protein-like I n=1 Tax=Catenaria anguillulae PL171 TaxID=765915 RepID=A0A1Y2I5W3_9FUNG|nr:periplasmic binding protein-like I [Catenaria anguillulae PL171]
MALIAQQLGMYTCTGAATTTILSDLGDFPSTFRTIPSDEQQGSMLARYIRAMGWSSCAVLSSNSEYGRSITVAFQRTASDLGIMVASSETLQFSNPNAATDGGFLRSLRATAEAGVRIVMFFGSAAEYLAISPLAKQVGMIGDEWVWIASEAVAGITDIVSSNSQYRQLTQGLQYIFPLEVADQRLAQSLMSRAQPAWAPCPASSHTRAFSETASTPSLSCTSKCSSLVFPKPPSSAAPPTFPWRGHSNRSRAFRVASAFPQMASASRRTRCLACLMGKSRPCTTLTHKETSRSWSLQSFLVEQRLVRKTIPTRSLRLCASRGLELGW